MTKPTVIATCTFAGFDCTVEKTEYCTTGNPALLLVDKNDGELVATATVNINGTPPGHVAIKDYSENTGMLAALRGADVIGDPVAYIRSGFVSIPVCPLNEEK